MDACYALPHMGCDLLLRGAAMKTDELLERLDNLTDKLQSMLDRVSGLEPPAV